MNGSFLGAVGTQCRGFLQDGLVWLIAVGLLGICNVALNTIPLHGGQKDLMESIHVKTLYATILITSAGTVTRLLVHALERVGGEE